MNLPRFYPILDTALAEARGFALLAAAEAIVEAGAGILQIRHKGHFHRELFAQCEQMAEVCRKAGALLVINDRADMAALLEAAVHLGQDDLSPAQARVAMQPGAVVGYSTHNQAQVEQANREPVDYVALGPVFLTATKVNPDPEVGLAELARLRRLSRYPLVAIGGITRTNAQAVVDAGADSVAVIGDLFAGVGSVAELHKRTREWLGSVRQSKV